MKKNYNDIEVKNNMQVDNNDEEVVPKEKIKMAKVVSVTPKKVKRGLVSRFITGVLGEEGLPGLGSYISNEIVKPTIKNMVVDGATSGMHMIADGIIASVTHAIYGENAPARHSRHGRTRGTHRPVTDYGRNYRSSQQEPERKVVTSQRYKVDEYPIADRVEASEVLAGLVEHADLYDTVAVSDYYDAIGVESKFTDDNYGWTYDSISRASIIPVRNGYSIKFPPVEAIS